jgi:hypothetical protein
MNHHHLPAGKAALAIYPTTTGVSWMLFDGPLSPVDWGGSSLAKRTKGAKAKNERLLGEVAKLLSLHRPHTLVLEDFESPASRREERIRSLCRSLISLAAVEGIAVHMLTRKQVVACFASSNATTRHEVAKVVVSYVSEIGRLLPSKRKAWEPEKHIMGLFNATALLIAHYANPREPL